MNIKVLQWLLRHRELLLKIVDVAKGFRKDADYIDQWDIVDKIARLVIPVVTQDDASLTLFSLTADDFDYDAVEIAAFHAGAEAQAMGIDWKALVEVILPLVVAILETFLKR